MRSLLIAGIFVCCGLSAPARAQTSPSVDWSGFYAGGNIGAAINAYDLSGGVAPGPFATAYFNAPSDLTQIGAASGGSANQSSFTGGVVGGYNAQYGNILLGLEAGANAFDGDAQQSVTATIISSPTAQFTLTQTVKSDWIATLRPRLGWAEANWLVYLTGGLALTRVDIDVAYSDNNGAGARGRGSASATKAGWTLGAGGEYALDRNWSLTGQYLFADFGSVDAATTVTHPTFSALSSVIDSSAELRTNLILVGATYRFGD